MVTGTRYGGIFVIENPECERWCCQLKRCDILKNNPSHVFTCGKGSVAIIREFDKYQEIGCLDRAVDFVKGIDEIFFFAILNIKFV